MKAISIRQPWASLIVGIPGVPGPKNIENRDWRWPPSYRGPLLIHASQKLHERALAWGDGIGLSIEEYEAAEEILCRAIARSNKGNRGFFSDDMCDPESVLRTFRASRKTGVEEGLRRRMLNLLPRGIIGRAEMVDVVSYHESPWFEGKFGFVLENREAFTEPIPYPGQLGLFDIPAGTVEDAETVEIENIRQPSSSEVRENAGKAVAGMVQNIKE